MVSIHEIYRAHDPFQQPEFDLVIPGPNHTVLYKIDSGVSKLEPSIGYADKWDSSHVKMPNSPKCIQEGKKNNSRWIYVQKALDAEITNFEELLKAILSYNPKFSKGWKFPVLKLLLEKDNYAHKFFKKILPKMQHLALKLPTLIGAPIPLLRKDSSHSISMSQQQIACLLANAFFCTYPRRNSTQAYHEYASYPKINFSSLFECDDYDSSGVLEKLKCLINYFDRVCSDPPKGFVTFSRRHVGSKGCPSWHTSQLPISSIPLHVDSETNIEDALGLIQVDFANKLLGGGVLGNGCVQEEIRFVICPELLVSMLFTEQLEDNDALMVIGCERYSKYSGYGRQNFRFDGDYRDHTPFDGSRRRRCAVLAIDATKYYNDYTQFDRRCVNRELNKAWIGFSAMNCKNEDGLQRPGIATGNWGCGVFRGHPELKALIQIMAGVQARRPMAYYTFLNNDFKNEFVSVYYALSTNQTTVDELYKMVMKYCDGCIWMKNVSPFQYIHAALQKNEQSTQGAYYNTELSRNRSPSNGKKNLENRANDSHLNNTENMDTSGSSYMDNDMPPRNRSLSSGKRDLDTRNIRNVNTTAHDPPLMNMEHTYMDTSGPSCTTAGGNRSHSHSKGVLNTRGIAGSNPDLGDVLYKVNPGPGDKMDKSRQVEKNNGHGIKDGSDSYTQTENSNFRGITHSGTNNFNKPSSYAAVAQTKSSTKQTQPSYHNNPHSNKESTGWPLLSGRPTDYTTSSSAIGSHCNQSSSNKSDTNPSPRGAHPGFTRARGKHNYTGF